MAFPIELASVLTGATLSQLRGWRSSGILVPEVSITESGKHRLYSFQDVVAGRMLAYIRKDVSLQKVRTGLSNMPKYGFTDHLSSYRLAVADDTIWIADEGGDPVDVVKVPGRKQLITMEDIFGRWKNFKEEAVSPFATPEPALSVSERVRGGWPVAAGTRVGFDALSDLLATGEVPVEDVEEYYPRVSREAARDALKLADRLRVIRREGVGAA